MDLGERRGEVGNVFESFRGQDQVERGVGVGQPGQILVADAVNYRAVVCVVGMVGWGEVAERGQRGVQSLDPVDLGDPQPVRGGGLRPGGDRPRGRRRTARVEIEQDSRQPTSPEFGAAARAFQRFLTRDRPRQWFAQPPPPRQLGGNHSAAVDHQTYLAADDAALHLAKRDRSRPVPHPAAQVVPRIPDRHQPAFQPGGGTAAARSRSGHAPRLLVEKLEHRLQVFKHPDYNTPGQPVKPLPGIPWTAQPGKRWAWTLRWMSAGRVASRARTGFWWQRIGSFMQVAVTSPSRPASDFSGPVENPFASELAVRHSRYYGTKAGRAVLLTDPKEPPDLFASTVVGAFRGFVLNPAFSCVGAKSAVMHESYRLGVYDQLGDEGPTAGLGRDLFTFSREVADTAEDGEFRSFVAIFRGPTDLDEAAFERRLWDQLRALNRLDSAFHTWDPAVSDDPANPHFGFSFARTAMFIVGLHPHSSREARRFPWPTLVFNPHAQFENLRQEGRWDRLQQVIRQRETQLQGSLNPNLADHGTATEARQYSGRAVEADWQAPFSRDSGAAAGGCPFLAAGGLIPS